jgi:hypothetical protein
LEQRHRKEKIFVTLPQSSSTMPAIVISSESEVSDHFLLFIFLAIRRQYELSASPFPSNKSIIL